MHTNIYKRGTEENKDSVAEYPFPSKLIDANNITKPIQNQPNYSVNY